MPSAITTIEQMLLRPYSKKNTLKLATLIGDDKKLFAELMVCFFGKDFRLCQHAANVLNNIANRHPSLFRPYFKNLITALRHAPHDSFKRNTLRLFQFIDIPSKYHGDLANHCFYFLSSRKEPIAIKIFSMTVLANLCQSIPEFKKELKLIIEDQLPFASPAFKNRASKILNRL